MLHISCSASECLIQSHFKALDDFSYIRREVVLVKFEWRNPTVIEVQSAVAVTNWRMFPAVGARMLTSSDNLCRFEILRAGSLTLLAGTQSPVLIQALPSTAFHPPRNHRTGADFGITANDGQDQTDAINTALRKMTHIGGGVLRLEAGCYPITTLRMQSNVMLHLDLGAELQASLDPESYSLQPDDIIQKNIPESLIPGARRRVVEFNHVENCGLSGAGIINGQGSELRRRFMSGGRPLINIVFAVHSRNITIQGVTLLDSEFWSTHLLHCDEVRVCHAAIVNEIPPPKWAGFLGKHAEKWSWNNADGINPDSAQNILIEDCLLHTGDDCVPIKNTGTWRGELRDVNNIICQRCVLFTPVTAMKIGTETRGDRICNIRFEDIDVISAGRPIGIELKDGATAANIVFRDIRVMECNRPFDFVILPRQDQINQSRYSHLRGVRVHNLQIERYGIEGAWYECRIQGFDAEHRVSDIELENILIADKPLASPSDPLIKINEHVDNIVFR